MKDLLYDSAKAQLDQIRKRTKHGRLHLWLDVKDDMTVDFGAELDDMTHDDYQKLMRERPGVKR